MNNRGLLATLLLAVFCVAAGGASAQDSTDDQVAVWAVIERLWATDNEGDSGWVEDLLSDDFVGWPYESPAPRNRASFSMWAEFGHRLRKPINYELFPLSIVVHGDTAIAHYLYTDAAEMADGKLVTTNGRYTDVLVREKRVWKFLSWHGGEFPPGGD